MNGVELLVDKVASSQLLWNHTPCTLIFKGHYGVFWCKKIVASAGKQVEILQLVVLDLSRIGEHLLLFCKSSLVMF